MLDGLVSGPAQALARALLFGGIMLVVGATLFVWRVAPAFAGTGSASQQVYQRALTTLRLAVALLAAVAVWRLVQQGAAFADSPAEWTGAVPTLLSHTTWGKGWLVQVVALALVVVNAPPAFRADRARRGPLGTSVLVLCAAPALAGHAVGSPRFAALAVVCDTLHVAAAGAWLGTLVLLAVVALPLASRFPSGVVTQLLARFSPIALAGASVLAITGAFASWLHVGSFDALISTPYGRNLLWKLALLAVVVGVGAYNWKIVTPRQRATGDARLLRRTAVAELALATAIVAVTSVLVATPLPAEM